MKTSFDFSLFYTMLFYSKDLTWRDVQHIIIRTSSSNPTVLHGGGWKTNGAGLRGNFLFRLLNINVFPV